MSPLIGEMRRLTGSRAWRRNWADSVEEVGRRKEGRWDDLVVDGIVVGSVKVLIKVPAMFPDGPIVKQAGNRLRMGGRAMHDHRPRER